MEKTPNIRLEIGNELRIGRRLHNLGTLSETEGNITTAADYCRLALQTIRRYEFLPENHPYVREAVESLQRTTEEQSTKVGTVMNTKRKMEELTDAITAAQTNNDEI